MLAVWYNGTGLYELIGRNVKGIILYHMNFGYTFFITNILLGVGLAMDAFSVSLANGLNEPVMKKHKMCGVAGVFALFQFAMPMIGWICVSTIANAFKTFEKFIPWIALSLLAFIGGKMIYESIKGDSEEDETTSVGIKGLIIQGIATSIDALSVGFTISDYNLIKAVIACILIGVVTFVICYAGLIIGKKAGTKLANKAGLLGGSILCIIGISIFIQ